jgi:hypothetical protein
LKLETLAKFDESVTKEEKGFEGGSGGHSVFLDFFTKIAENFILEINDLEIIYVYHVFIFYNLFTA